jgi:Zn-dependent peptidase ImmA (M78 family)
MAYRDISFKGTAQEVQANRFAAELLIPEWMVRPALSITGPDVARLAAMFDVSEAAMATRLDDLGVDHS